MKEKLSLHITKRSDRKEYYQSPSVRRRKKSEAARKNKNKRYY